MTLILGGAAVPNVVAHGRRIRTIDRRMTSGSAGTAALRALLPGRRQTMPLPSNLPPATTSTSPLGQLTGRLPAGSSVLGRACSCAYC